MNAVRTTLGTGLVLAGFALAGSALAIEDVPLGNWPVPSTASKGMSALADAGSPGLFIPVTPCRVADTRNAAGAYGGPALIANASRSFDIDSGPCTGIPPGASAFSLNFTILASSGVYQNAFLSVWPTGSAQPTVSTLNFDGGQLRANAAIVPAGTGGAVSVFVNAAAHLIIDINGYFMDKGGSITSGDYVGIFGNTDPNAFGLLYVSNASTSAGRSAIRGIIDNAGTGTFGTSGESQAATGRTYGVKGINASASTDAAGVYGVAGSANATTGWFPSGVRGESTTGNGVLGVGQAVSSFGVGGFRVDAVGSILRSGFLGSDTYGVTYSGGLGGSGTKSFLEPHPTDPSRMIAYVALEGPEAGTYFRGRGRFVGGSARIDVPESFRMVTDPEGLTVQVTAIGRTASVGVVWISLDVIEVEANRDVEFSYLVQGVRKAYRDLQPIVANTFFRPSSAGDRMPVSLSAEEKQRLVENGTFNEDGTVNMTTAERVGWAQLWREREEAARTEAARMVPQAVMDNRVNGASGPTP